MPYQLVAARARTKALDAAWEDVQIGDTDLNLIYQSYRRVILTLSHPAYPQQLYLDLADVRDRIGAYTGTRTVNAWLAANGDNALPTMSQPPSFRFYPVQYNDAWVAGYQIDLADMTRHPSLELPLDDKHDLLLQRPVDLRNAGSYLLATVNGFVHRTVGTEHGVYIPEGGRTVRLGNDNRIGLYSFRNVGAFQTIPITHDMVYKLHDNQRLSDFAMIRSPVSLENKTVLLSIGGHLQILDASYVVTGSHGIRVETAALQLTDRIFGALGQIDLGSLGLVRSSDNPDQFAVDQLKSDEVIRAYLSLPQSFLIVMDRTDIYVRRHALETSGIPGRYFGDPPYRAFPLVSAYGRFHEYIPFHQRGVVVYATTDIRRHNWLYQTADLGQTLSLDNTRYGYDPTSLPMAFLLEFGRVA